MWLTALDACARESGRFPFAFTAELSVDESRAEPAVGAAVEGPPCEFGGESSVAARVWSEVCMGVDGLLGRASSGNISSSSAEECIVESPSMSSGEEGGVSWLATVMMDAVVSVVGAEVDCLPDMVKVSEGATWAVGE